MNELERFGLDLTIIAAIVIITLIVKKQDTKQRFKRFYVLIPLALGVLVAIPMTEPWFWKTYALSAFKYAAFAAYAYSFKKLIPQDEPQQTDGQG